MKTLDDYQSGQILLIDKPLNWTSFQVVNKIRWRICKHFNIKKIKVGHAGTLDPLATGLLILCTGKMTKRIDEFQAQTKTYTGKILLGSTTPSYDLETAIDKTYPTAHITPSLIKATAKKFIGEI
ncbi:MAG: tRNA pseudouridine(55) synthase, partial [Bacteroidia bacterium]|nr:tRNA pseudouridine(55) synthase [Bacteroidia bacterium]